MFVSGNLVLFGPGVAQGPPGLNLAVLVGHCIMLGIKFLFDEKPVFLFHRIF